jgi:AcrR family transcriptional regulator
MTGDLRTQVLAASVTLIAEAGLAGLSMREVARRAGVSHQAPYHHFPDKASIVASLVERGFTMLAERMEACEARRGSPPQRLARVGRAYVDFALEQPVYFRLMFRPELVDLSRFPSAQAAGARAFTVLQRLVAARVEGQRMPARKVKAMVSLHWSVVHGLAALMLDGSLGVAYADASTRAAHIDETLALVAGLL